MTDEEKLKNAKEIVCKDCKWQICCSNQCSILLNTIKAIDVGLTEGKPKWHNLREDSNDLPPKITWCSSTVVNQIGTPCHYNYDKSYWENWSFIRINTPIAWCELPKFEG